MTKRRVFGAFEPITDGIRDLWDSLKNSGWEKPFLAVLLVLALLTARNMWILWQEKGVIALQGENPSSANCSFIKASNAKFLKGKSLEIAVAELPKGKNAFVLTYRFRIYEEGVYRIFIAGTPPGSASAQIEWDWFSPFKIVLDQNEPISLTKESIEKSYPLEIKWIPYVVGGYTWTRAGELPLKKGTHELKIVIDEKRKKDGWYVYYLDAVILAPKDWKPVRSLKKEIPAEFFAA